MAGHVSVQSPGQAAGRVLHAAAGCRSLAWLHHRKSMSSSQALAPAAAASALASVAVAAGHVVVGCLVLVRVAVLLGLWLVVMQLLGVPGR